MITMWGYKELDIRIIGGIIMLKVINGNNLYDEFLQYSYNELKELFKKSKTKEEKDFYMTLSNLVLQREQEKVISGGKQ